MKPAFALDFRESSLGLLHRSGAGWVEVGAVALDNPDLPEALGYLRSTALGLSPRGLATKLIIPNDQILYITVDAPGPDDAARLLQIRAALEGRTPYDVADLAFDWSARGDLVQVAVIARETLAEAEAFAAEHRLNPVAFVALPQDGVFAGEPWFGPTALAASLLAPGETVERDAAPVNLVARGFAAALPEPVVQPELDFAPPEPAEAELAEALPEPEVLPEPEFVPEPEVYFEPEVVPEPEVYLPPEIVVEPEPEVAPEYWPELDDVPEPATLPRPEPQGLNAPVFADEFDELPDPVEDQQAFLETAVGVAQDVVPPKPVEAPAPVVEADEAPMALDVPDDEPEAPPVSARVTDPVIDDPLPAAPSEAAMMAFSSRRAADEPVKAMGGRAPALGSAIASKGSVPRPAAAKPIGAVAGGVERPVVARPTVAAAPPKAAIAAKPNATGKALRGLGALVGGSAGAAGKKAAVKAAAVAPKPAPVPAQPTAEQPKRAQPPRSGIGLGGKPAPIRGKPKHLGLILTLVLLLCLALVAAWSSYALAFWQGSDPAVETAVMESETPAPDDEMLADMQDPEVLAAENTAAQLGETAAIPAPDIAADVDPAPNVVQGADAQDEILLATMDAPPNAPDALALPEADARGDPLPEAQPAPPPFGTIYQFDADGLIRPTPEGIITPEGVLLKAGKPARVPTSRPPEVIAAAAAVAAPVAGVTAELPVNPALVGKRPQTRPEGLVPAAPEDDAALAPAVDSRLAGLRPQARPKTILAAGDAARLASANASLAAQAEAKAAADAEAASAAAAAGRSKLAVAISRKPEARPRDLSKAVEAAVAAAIRAPEPEPDPEPTKAAAKAPEKEAAPEADNEPEVASAAPSIPTRASVAKQATFKNAINLSKVNLIGVYGSDRNRYALIRQSNGRFKKVKIGDKIDGGQVAAITASEVRYKKGGKMLSLAMPKG